MLKEYCEVCNEIANLTRKEKVAKEEIKGKEYEYIKVIDYCSKCGNPVSSKDSIDENLRRIDKAYREEEKIISIEEIEEILRKYKIGKKPLSKLLGWGEVTITRYINGDIPSKFYSDELYKILNSSNYMLEILERNKDNIAENAYLTSINAIKQADYNMSDIELIAQYIIMKCEEITPLALQKLLYYSQGFYKAFFGNFLFNSDCEAWVHGPVYNEIYYKYKFYGSKNIEQYLDYDISEILDEDKKNLLDVIIKYFGFYNGKALEKMTHYERPWLEARRGMSIDEKCNNIISKDNISDYFEKIKEKYSMIDLTDIREYSEKHFFEVIGI